METNIIKIEQTMTSLEIAELTGKQHKNIMQAIRNMEPAWEKVNGLKFQLVEYRDRKGELRPCYQLSKTECLYIATKFNDEARAKLVLRWEYLERQEQERQQQLCLPSPKKILALADDIIGTGLRVLNDPAEDTLTVSSGRSLEPERRSAGPRLHRRAHPHLLQLEGPEEDKSLHDLDHGRSAFP